MSAGQVVLLAGVFVPPLLMLAMGHSYRHRTPPARSAFWGGVVGYGVGVIVTVIAMLVPAVAWGGGPVLRAFVVHGALLAGSVVGMAAGWAKGARRPGARTRPE